MTTSWLISSLYLIFIFCSTVSGSEPNVICQEINECESNPCLNGGTCRDEVNNFVCQCRNGFTGQRCENANDYCSTRQNPCLNGGTCRNLPESASTTCDCPPGYGGDFCQDDIDECVVNNPCVNAQGCINHVSHWKDISFFSHPYSSHLCWLLWFCNNTSCGWLLQIHAKKSWICWFPPPKLCEFLCN